MPNTCGLTAQQYVVNVMCKVIKYKQENRLGGVTILRKNGFDEVLIFHVVKVFFIKHTNWIFLWVVL